MVRRRRAGTCARMEASNPDGSRPLIVDFEDYRAADGILTPYVQRVEVPGATITYSAATVRYGQEVDPSVFAAPR